MNNLKDRFLNQENIIQSKGSGCYLILLRRDIRNNLKRRQEVPVELQGQILLSIRRNFNDCTNLDSFMMTHYGDHIEISPHDHRRGYVFSTMKLASTPSWNDFEKRIAELQENYQKKGKHPVEKVVSYKTELAGFSWEERR
jgi:hypothetical protein